MILQNYIRIGKKKNEGTDRRVRHTGAALPQQVARLDFHSRKLRVYDVPGLGGPSHRGLDKSNPGRDGVAVFILHQIF